MKYLADLHGSLQSYLTSAPAINLTTNIDDPVGSLSNHRFDSEQKVSVFSKAMVSAVIDGRDAVERNALSAGKWPRMTTSMFLAQLTRISWRLPTNKWKACVVKFGLALTEAQHAAGLLKAAKDPPQLSHELSNPGHENWDPHEFPEWLSCRSMYDVMSNARVS